MWNFPARFCPDVVNPATDWPRESKHGKWAKTNKKIVFYYCTFPTLADYSIPTRIKVGPVNLRSWRDIYVNRTYDFFLNPAVTNYLSPIVAFKLYEL